MKKVTILGLVIGVILILYLISTLVFVVILQTTSNTPPTETPTPEATFTPTATVTPLVVVKITPETPTPITPSPTSSPVPPDPPTFTPTSTATATPVNPQVVSSVTVNVRSGPGIIYPVIGALSPNISLPATGQNEQGDWWQIQQNNDLPGWVSASVVEATAVESLPIVQAPPTPEPTPVPITSTPTRPPHQYEPTGWYNDTNLGLTRFLGNITDLNGNPVNGVTVEARCGTYHIISNPSGPVPAFDSHDSAGDPPGFYDITVDTRPIPCKWLLTVVYTEDGNISLFTLSESVEIEVTVQKSIVVANWRKNW